jgi:hypothetical protein
MIMRLSCPEKGSRANLYAKHIAPPGHPSRIPTRRGLNGASSTFDGDGHVQDIIWMAIMLGLTAATLAYVRLCDNA